MNLAALARDRGEAGTPVRAALIGAGKFGSMFLSQVPGIAGLQLVEIADLDQSAPARVDVVINATGVRLRREMLV